MEEDKVIMKIILVISLVSMVFTMFMLIKNKNTFFNRIKIIDAISYYNQTHGDTIESSQVMEKYENTLYRLWDFGCKNIVPKDIYVKIKDYL